MGRALVVSAVNIDSAQGAFVLTLEEVAVAGTLPLLGAWLVLMPWMAAGQTHHIRPDFPRSPSSDSMQHSPWPGRCPQVMKGSLLDHALRPCGFLSVTEPV